MLNAIKSFFQLHIQSDIGTDTTREHGLRLATAALLMEMSRADHEISPEEREMVERLVSGEFGLSRKETAELRELAEMEAREAVSLYQFTSLINDHFTPEEKVRVVEMLWRVAFADRSLDKYEEALVRRIAELIYVPHRDFIQAKHRVAEALGLE